MHNFYQYLISFKNRKGLGLFSTSLVEKMSNFLISSILIIILDKSMLGELSYAQSIIVFFTAFTGLGTNSALLQMGAQLHSKPDRNKLYSYSLINGFYATLGVLIISIIIALVVAKSNIVLMSFLLLLGLKLVPTYLVSTLSSWFRLNLENHKLYRLEWVRIALQTLFSLILLFAFNVYGYLVSLLIVPLIVFLLYVKKVPISFKVKWDLPEISRVKYWKFSIFSSLSLIISQIIFAVDALFIYNMLNESANAEYRVASLIPFNILFIPLVFMKTDYAMIAKNAFNKHFLVQYYKNYFILFLLITTLGFAFGFFFGEELLALYGKQYQPYQMFVVLLFASCVSMLLRVPLGNIISALGKSDFNFYSAIFTLILDVILNVILIKKYGLIGAAYATAISLIFSGILNLLYFCNYVFRLKDDGERHDN